MLLRNSQLFGSGEWFFTARYNFNLLTGKGLDITRKNVCHYQGHTLNLLAGIWGTLQKHGDNLTATDGWRLSEAMDRLLEGGGELVGLRSSKHALYQFYRTEDPYYRYDIWNCPADPGVDRLTKDSYDVFEPFFGPWPGGYR